MSKRFTETNKWDDPWFRRLSPKQKCLWHYLCDRCDAAGVIDFDSELASFHIGEKIKDSDMEVFAERVSKLDSGRLVICKFLQFQYGTLSETCPAHKPVLKLVEGYGFRGENHEIQVPKPMPLLGQNGSRLSAKSGLKSNVRQRIIARDGLFCLYTGEAITVADASIEHVIPKSKGGLNRDDNLFVASKRLNTLRQDQDIEEFCEIQKIDYSKVLKRIGHRLAIGYSGLLNTLQEEDKEEDKDKTEGGAGGNQVVIPVKREALPTSPEAIRIANMFHRRLTTEWEPKEVSAFKQAKPTGEELDLLEPYYAAEREKGEKGMHRRDMTTFLNNFRGELDRAHGWKHSQQQINGNKTHEHAPQGSVNEW